jgi:carotenoid cleavage dioxygenase-like enzyme
MQPLTAALATAALLAAVLPTATAIAQQQDVPEGYVQILERGGIAAIDDPVYVPAAQAQIRDEAWVLGLVIDGQARAYSLELLNSHEVVNDSIGDTDFAAVW